MAIPWTGGNDPLPYDMGNAGDLLKHGVLAEYVRWQCELGLPPRFLDPFGGEGPASTRRGPASGGPGEPDPA